MRLTGLLAVLAAGLAFSGEREFAGSKELALGKALAAEVERNFQPLDDAVTAGYVMSLGNKLARIAGLEFPLTLYLAADANPAGATLPGGFLILSSGVIQKAASETELASILAHAIGHMVSHHGTRPVRPGPGYAAIPVVFAGGWTGVCTRFGSSRLLPKSMERYSSGWEREAETLGAGYLRRAGYDPAAPVSSAPFEEVQRRLGVPKPPSLRR